MWFGPFLVSFADVWLVDGGGRGGVVSRLSSDDREEEEWDGDGGGREEGVEEGIVSLHLTTSSNGCQNIHIM